MRTRQEIKAEMKAVAERGRRMTALQNECGEGYDHTDVARIEQLSNELQAAIAAEWTIEATQARRAAWNASIKAMAGRRITPQDVAAIEAANGFTLDELKAAIARHNIK